MFEENLMQPVTNKTPQACYSDLPAAKRKTIMYNKEVLPEITRTQKKQFVSVNYCFIACTWPIVSSAASCSHKQTARETTVKSSHLLLIQALNTFKISQGIKTASGSKLLETTGGQSEQTGALHHFSQREQHTCGG